MSRKPKTSPVPAGELPPTWLEYRCAPSRIRYSAMATSLSPAGASSEPPKSAGALKMPVASTPVVVSATPSRNTEEVERAHRIDPGALHAPLTSQMPAQESRSGALATPTQLPLGPVQVWHGSHALRAQHFSSTQEPDAHWALSPQAAPRGRDAASGPSTGPSI